MEAKKRLVVWGVVGLIGLAGQPAVANPDRPDLMNTDTDGTVFYQFGVNTPGGIFSGRITPYLYEGSPRPESEIAARGVVDIVRIVGGESVIFMGSVRSPDKVNRLPDRSKAVMTQRAYAPVEIQYFIDGILIAEMLPTPRVGCQTKIRYQNYDPGSPLGNLPGAWTEAQGTLVCDQADLESGITDPQSRARIQQIMGTKSDGTGIRAQFTLPGNNS